ncbi:hypothetical protein [Streptomyces sp. NPDC056491]|uniref:hypothetical protein n=1 Tax=Streptomyces sp. NPDC056491 TaxID=3345837 RepID=UPI0036AC437F
MTKFLLSVHVLAAIITIGPVTVAASMFPAVARRALADADADADAGVDSGAAVLPAARTLHRICRVYAVIAVVVPVFGLATANSLHVLTSPWLLTSIALTAAAAAVLGGLVLPRQAAALAGLRTAVDEQRAAPAVLRALAQMGTYTGLFNLLWATVTVLMIVRPGSTTGA